MAAKRLPSPVLVPSSMSGGNTVQDDGPEHALTAPGSRSILPVPDAVDYLPLPVADVHRRTVLTDAGGGKPDDVPGSGGWRLAGGYEETSAGGWHPC